MVDPVWAAEEEVALNASSTGRVHVQTVRDTLLKEQVAWCVGNQHLSESRTTEVGMEVEDKKEGHRGRSTLEVGDQVAQVGMRVGGLLAEEDR